MLWFLIWTVLVVGTLVETFFLLRWLWRRFVAMSNRIAACGERLGDVMARFDNEEGKAAPPVPAISMSVAELDEMLSTRRANLARRQARKTRRRELTFARWRAIAGTADGPLSLREQKTMARER